MKVNLLIEEDDLFREHVRRLIEGQVRHILREQLDGIVAGEIAKLRLLQPNSPSLSNLVADEIKRHTAGRINSTAVADEIKRQVRNEVAAIATPLAKEIKQVFSDELAARIRA